MEDGDARSEQPIYQRASQLYYRSVFVACYPAWKSRESTRRTRRHPPDITSKQLSTTVSSSSRASLGSIRQAVKRNSARSRSRPNRLSTTCARFQGRGQRHGSRPQVEHLHYRHKSLESSQQNAYSAVRGLWSSRRRRKVVRVSGTAHKTS